MTTKQEIKRQKRLKRRLDRAQELRNTIAGTLDEWVPATDARRAIDDLDELVKLVRENEEN